MMAMVRARLNHNSINQYKIEERSIVARRIISSGVRLKKLVEIMQETPLSSPEKINQLRQEIFKFTKDDVFLKSTSMGALIAASFTFIRRHYEDVDMHSLF